MTRFLSILAAATALSTLAAPGAAEPVRRVLLDDTCDLSAWRMESADKPVAWPCRNGVLEVRPGAGSIMTREPAGDFRLHLEFQVADNGAEGQSNGNSGVYIQRRYEVQILHSYGQPPLANGCAAIYNLRAPDSNASRPAGEWQTYDITFRAPRWDDAGTKTRNARITVIHNGITVHDDVEIPSKTGAGQPEGPTPGPILLQDHGNPVRFRNIWLAPLDNP